MQSSSRPATSLCHLFPSCSSASRWSNVQVGNRRNIKYSHRYSSHEIQPSLRFTWNTGCWRLRDWVQSKTIRSSEPAQSQRDQIWTGQNQSDQMRSNRLTWDQTRLQLSGESGPLKSSQQSERQRKSDSVIWSSGVNPNLEHFLSAQRELDSREAAWKQSCRRAGEEKEAAGWEQNQQTAPRRGPVFNTSQHRAGRQRSDFTCTL